MALRIVKKTKPALYPG